MAEESGQPSTAQQPEAPRGFHQARVDEKGRLKLPAPIVQYLDGLGERKVFITTLDAEVARIYPKSVWLQTEATLEQSGDDTEDRVDVGIVANHFGADDEIDGQGRVLVPTELRRALKFENEQVFLRCSKGRIEVVGREVYEERLAKAMTGIAAKLGNLEKKGLR